MTQTYNMEIVQVRWKDDLGNVWDSAIVKEQLNDFVSQDGVTIVRMK